ncbi:MAG: HigA family addiction module antitoxin [Gemmatimonadota bacterium]
MRRLPKFRRPTHPGAVLLEEFLEPLGITQKDAADRLHVSYPRMNEIVNGKRAVTPETALRLARFTDTEPEFWLNLQQAVDLWDAMHSATEDIKRIEPATVR